MISINKIQIALLVMFAVLSSSNAFADYEKFKEIAWKMMSQKIPVNTRETIKLKNVEFKGDVKTKLIELCNEEVDATNKKWDFKREEDVCLVDKDGIVIMGWFIYGNLTPIKKGAWAQINDKGELMYFNKEAKEKQFYELIDLLQVKYGKPTIVKDNYFVDKNGDRIKRQQTYWKDTNGTVMAIDNITDSSSTGSYYNNTGQIYIMSKDFINKITDSVNSDIKANENRKKELLKKL